MLLEKIKEHGGKIMFFMMNVLLVSVGALFIKEKNTEIKNNSILEVDAENLKSITDYALEAQLKIAEDKIAKINSIANNPDTIKTTKVVGGVVGEAVVSSPVATAKVSTKSTSTKSVAPVVVQNKVNGTCGSAKSSAKRGNSKCDGKAPSANLCSSGSASSISFKPNKYDLGWNWTCAGQNGGTSATCRCS
ncbi:MAG: hypothetical protein ACD_9C00260G0003 [uncultured bacterium]|nr:MAG: hypothetical protein ACD_9C00260G0003 [uncultured bacterium]